MTALLAGVSLSLKHDHQAHQSQHHSLQSRIFTQQYCDITHARDIASHASNNVLFPVQVTLSLCVELRVIGNVVVALGQEFRRGGR